METTSTGADEDAPWHCAVPPSVFFLLGTLVLTACATAMLCGAIMTDHWEEVTWDERELKRLSNGTEVELEFILDRKVVRVLNREAFRKKRGTTFLVPMHGGIWTLCVSLNEEEIGLLDQVDFPKIPQCVNYLSGPPKTEPRPDWQHRMQNLSISCALVCLIILGTAALVGAFGVCQHQISAVLVTGVMYLLAASFALFTLTIIHFKRVQSKPRLGVDDGTADGVVSSSSARGAEHLFSARVFTTSWSLDLGWGGVVLTAMASVLWMLLSKIMRFNPIQTSIN
ncbi:uncharacterized protein [Onthophagus taurus]|nr:uncharacterized protein LOC111418362 [Onthophagus taurus]XP_022906662.1 uncharacterized protein LOC111418362 [Onthophagus taurus]XP_022906663.1 uncharacterized protein LOC111418362 [Onthophagus taurus]